MSTAAEPVSENPDTPPAFPFKVRPGDLVLRAKITLQDHEGVEVVDVDNFLKIDSVMGEYAYVTALRRIERAVEFSAITSFQVQVAEMLQRELIKRKRVELVTPAFGANREWPEQEDQPNIADQLKERLDKPMLRAAHELSFEERREHEEQCGQPVKGFFQRSAV